MNPARCGRLVGAAALTLGACLPTSESTGAARLRFNVCASDADCGPCGLCVAATTTTLCVARPRDDLEFYAEITPDAQTSFGHGASADPSVRTLPIPAASQPVYVPLRPVDITHLAGGATSGGDLACGSAAAGSGGSGVAASGGVEGSAGAAGRDGVAGESGGEGGTAAPASVGPHVLPEDGTPLKLSFGTLVVVLSLDPKVVSTTHCTPKSLGPPFSFVGDRATLRWSGPGGLVAPPIAITPTLSGPPLLPYPVWSLAASLPIKASPAEYTEEYSLYLEPIDDGACRRPPLLVRGVTLAPPEGATQAERQGPISKTVGCTLSAPNVIGGAGSSVLLPPAASLEHWRVEVVDPASGFVLSTVGEIGPRHADGTALFGVAVGKSHAALEYYDPVGPDCKHVPATLALRVTPPAGVFGPVLAWDLGALDPNTTGVVTLDVRALDLTPVTLRARLERLDEGVVTGFGGRVALRSRAAELTAAPPGVLSRLVATGVTSAEPDPGAGDVSFELLPGSYDVVGAAGLDEPRRLARARWQLSSEPVQAGRVLDLARPATLPLRVVEPRPLGDAGIEGAFVEAVALTPDADKQRPFAAALGGTLPTAYGANALTDPQGATTLVLDDAPSAFSVVVRPNIESLLPWSVTTGEVLTAKPVVELSLPLLAYGAIGFDVPSGGAGIVTAGRVRVFGRRRTTAPGEAPPFVLVADTSISSKKVYQTYLPSRL